MILVDGKIQFIKEKKWKDKQNKDRIDYEVDIKQESERYFDTIQVPDEVGKTLKKDQQVTLPVRIYTYTTKSGNPFMVMKLDLTAYKEALEND